jgi:molecular chaperone GrpE
MSDAPPPVRAPGTSGDAAPTGPLTPEAIDRILGNFRAWLTEAAAPAARANEPPPVDLLTLVAQFTALRHEVNLQTKAARSSLEQTGEALARLGDAVEALEEEPPANDELKPLLKAVVDVYDNLGIALRQATRQREALDKALGELAVVPVRPHPVGFWARLFGAKAASPTPDDRQQRAADAATLIRSSLDALIAGYKMSLARVDRALAQFELETIPAEGQTFDPELMEAVEIAGDSGLPAGEVVEELRRGYLWHGTVFRYAQVKVAR